MFISFDGSDGVGKSTQIQLLVEWLTSQGHQLTQCRDPGSTDLGEALREILLSGRIDKIARRSEMLIYMAARAQLVEEIISPALSRGETVLSDRFLLSNVVYQGYGGGLEIEDIWNVGQVACNGIFPDVTIVLDMEPQAAMKRLNRELDRMEQQGMEFREKLREGFQHEAEKNPEKIILINADQSIEAVQQQIQTAVTKVL